METQTLVYRYECDQDEIDTLGLKLTVTEAAEYSQISAKTFLRDAMDGYLAYEGELPDELPDKKDKEGWQQLADSVKVYLSELPPFAIRRYLMEHIVSGEIFHLDFAIYKHRHGKKKFDKLINDMLTIKTIYEIWNLTGDKERSDTLRELLEEHSISRSAYYRYLSHFQSSNLRQLLDDKCYQARSLCPLAEDFINECVFNDFEMTYEDIFLELQEVRKKLGTVCTRCPHNVNSYVYEETKQYLKENYPDYHFRVCRTGYSQMRIPYSKAAIGRYIRSMDESEKDLARTICVDKKVKLARQMGLDKVEYKEEFSEPQHRKKEVEPRAHSTNWPRNKWTAEYGDKVIRNKPEKVNEVVFADHCQLNVWLFAGYDRQQNPVIMRPWVTCLLDFASGAIIGSVVSFSVTKYNIAECICRAAAVTMDSPFYGLPQVLYCDRGKDFLAKHLVGSKKKMTVVEDGVTYPNRAVFSDGLLQLLNVEIRHARPHSPWTKPIEGAFRIINSRLLRRVPGHCGKKTRSYYSDVLEAEKRRLLRNQQLWDIEQFSYYWFHHVIPAFNNRTSGNGGSPLKRYLKLERADTLTPSWGCMAAMLQERKMVKVQDQGIFYNNNLYADMKLTKYINKQVIVYDFSSYVSDCIYVMYSDEETKTDVFIGEIPLKERVDTLEKKRVKLARNLMIRNIQKNNIADSVEVVHYMNEYMNMCRLPYDQYDMVTREITRTMYAEKADAKRKSIEQTDVSPVAKELHIAMLMEQVKMMG